MELGTKSFLGKGIPDYIKDDINARNQVPPIILALRKMAREKGMNIDLLF